MTIVYRRNAEGWIRATTRSFLATCDTQKIIVPEKGKRKAMTEGRITRLTSTYE